MTEVQNLDDVTLASLNLLEPRLRRLERILYGTNATVSDPPASDPLPAVIDRLETMERRFLALIRMNRVYGDLLQISNQVDNQYPSLFATPEPSDPPTQLPPDAIRATILSSASAFSSTASYLSALQDCPVPDVELSVVLATSTARMHAIEATQLAQAAEAAQLRRRSESVLTAWLAKCVLPTSQKLVDVESRVQHSERIIRQHERKLQEQNEETY